MSSFAADIVIAPFPDFSTTNASGKRYISKIENAKDNVIVTHFRHSKYSPFPKEGGKFNITNEQRDNLSFNFNEDNDEEHVEKYGDNKNNDKKTMECLNSFTSQYNIQKEKVFSNNTSKAKKGKSVSDNYFFLPLLKDNNEEGEKNKSITSRFAFNKKFTLYYKGEKIDDANNKIINNALFPKGGKSKKGDEFKKWKESLTFNIYWPQGSQEKILVPYTDMDEKKEFKVNVIYREIEDPVDKIRKPNEFSNEDLEDPDTLEEFNSLYGEPQIMTIETPQELEKYYKAGTYSRIGYIVPEFWVEANPIAKGKQMDAGFKTYCECIDIIYIKTKFTNTNSNKNNIVNKMYKNMAFDVKKSNDVKQDKLKTTEALNKSPENSDEYDEIEVSGSEEDDGSESEEEIIVKKSDKNKTNK